MITQEQVDEIKLRVMAIQIRQYLDKPGQMKIPLKHVRFPEDRHTKYELRLGNPPAPSDRRVWERKLDLVVDCTPVPAWVEEILRPGGLLDQYNRSAEVQMKPQDALTATLEVRKVARESDSATEFMRSKGIWRAPKIHSNFKGKLIRLPGLPKPDVN